MGVPVQSFCTFAKCVKQYRDVTAWRVRSIFERIPNIHMISKHHRMKSTFGELRPIFYASREVKQRERKKAKGLHMQNNNFARDDYDVNYLR